MLPFFFLPFFIVFPVFFFLPVFFHVFHLLLSLSTLREHILAFLSVFISQLASTQLVKRKVLDDEPNILCHKFSGSAGLRFLFGWRMAKLIIVRQGSQQ